MWCESCQTEREGSKCYFCDSQLVPSKVISPPIKLTKQRSCNESEELDLVVMGEGGIKIRHSHMNGTILYERIDGEWREIQGAYYISVTISREELPKIEIHRYATPERS